MQTPASTSAARPRPELTRWKKILLAGAGAFIVIGGCLEAVGGDASGEAEDLPVARVSLPESRPQTAPGAASAPGPMVKSLDPGASGAQLPGPVSDTSEPIEWPPVESPPESEPGETPESQPRAGPGAAGWSPFFFKGGFSFFVAFCVGYAMRVWLKVAALVLGTVFLGVFLLSYTGVIIGVDWARLEGWWDVLAAHVEAEAVDFKSFLTGSLPQAGMATLGLVAGFRRR